MEEIENDLFVCFSELLMSDFTPGALGLGHVSMALRG